MKIKTVNVIEYVDDSILGLTSFNDDQEGNQEAKELFKTLNKEHDSEVTENELGLACQEGYYEQGNYQLFLVHSS